MVDITSQSTTGFGDCYPVTYLGRAFTVVGAMLGGVLIIALIQSLFFGALDLSVDEQTVKFLIDTERWSKDVSRTAALVIQTAWKSHRHGHLHVKTRRKLFALVTEARELRGDKPVIEQQAEEMISDMETEVLAVMNRLNLQQAEVLARIQDKAARLEQLRFSIENQTRK